MGVDIAKDTDKTVFISITCKDGRIINLPPNTPNETLGVFALNHNKFNCGRCGGFIALDWEADLYKWHICHNCGTHNANPNWQPNPNPLTEYGEQADQHNDNPDLDL